MNVPELPIAAAELVPHRPPMLLIDRIVVRDREADTGAVVARLPEEGAFLSADGRILPEYFVEVAAQSMAAVNGYDALCDGEAHGGGYLVGVDEFRWVAEMVGGGMVTIRVDRQMQVGPISLIAFEVSSPDHRLVAAGVLRTWEAR